MCRKAFSLPPPSLPRHVSRYHRSERKAGFRSFPSIPVAHIMSWKLGKSKSKQSSSPNLSVQDLSPRSTTPTPGNPDGKPMPRSGLLAIRVLWAEDLTVPGGVIPPAVTAALNSQQAKVAASVSPSSVNQQRLASKRSNRDSVQRTQCWWLPYIVMEFEVNQVLITPLGGDLQKPLYMYETNL